MVRGFAAVSILGAALAAPGRAAADPAASCPPAARVAGDPELAHAVVVELAILGVASLEIPAGCAAAEVTVTGAAGGLAIGLRDGAGREASEVVSDPSVAAAWIESWLHPEIGAPLLAARTAPGEVAAAPAADLATAEVSARAAPRPRFAYQGLRFAAAGEVTAASDDSDWRALSAAACARFGVLCAGLTARGADNRGSSFDGGLTEVNRYQLELVATLSASFELGRMTLVPSAGLGLAYSQTSHAAGAECFDQLDPTGAEDCLPPYAVDDGFVAYSVGPRAEVGLGGAFPIAGPLSLTLGVGLSFAPMARGEPAMPDYARDYFDALDGGNPDMPPPDGMALPLPEESYRLPAEPSRFTRIGLGLSWETR